VSDSAPGTGVIAATYHLIDKKYWTTVSIRQRLVKTLGSAQQPGLRLAAITAKADPERSPVR